MSVPLFFALYCVEAGFADASHLCRVFAKAHAVTPKAYRALCSASQTL